MQVPLLNAYAAMLPRLAAEESLRRVSELIAATPEVERRDRERIVGEWRRQAEPDRDVSQLTPEQMQARLALAGIGVRRVKT